MGIGAFVWVPLSLAVGRRPVFLLCAVILLLSTIWAALAGSFYQLLAAICLQGLAEGLATSTVCCLFLYVLRDSDTVKMLLMVIDLTFIHQRPQVIAMLWSIGGAITLSLLSLVPYMTNGGIMWRRIYSIWSTLCGMSLILAFSFYPETYFLRPAVAFDGHILVQSATEKVKLYEDWAEVPGGKSLPDIPEKSRWMAIVKQLSLCGRVKGGWRAMLVCYPQAALCMLNPLVFWVALLNAINFGGMLSIGMTYAGVLSAEPYSLSMNVISLVNLSAAFGSFLAWPASGFMIARICRRLAMRNGGVRDAEHYLPAFALPILASAASVVLYGLTAQRKWHWILVYISYALNAFAFAGLSTANTLWVTEAFPRWASAGIIVVGGGSYVASFGMSYAIYPWVRSQGFERANMQIGVMLLVVGGIVIPIAFWGKKLRQNIHEKWGIIERGALRPQ